MISISSLIGQSLFLQDLLNQGLLDNYDFVITVDDNGSLVENDGLSFEEELSTIYNNYEKKYFDRNATIESLYETYTNDFLAYREVEVLVLFHSFTSGDSEELAAQRQAAIDIFSDAKTTALQENVTLGEMYSRLLNDPGVFEIDSSFDTKNGYIPNQVIYRNDQFLTDPDVINDIIWNLNEGEISDPFVGYDPIEEGDEVSATSNRFDESFVSIVRIITKKDGIDVNDEFDFFYEYGLKGVNDGGSKYLYSLTNE
jgi:hypothetical protein